MQVKQIRENLTVLMVYIRKEERPKINDKVLE